MAVNYHKIIKQFTNYLITLGYGNSVCYNTPNLIIHFLEYIDKSVKQINKSDVDAFIEFLQNITSERTNEELSNVHINGYIIALKRFSKFLLHSYNINLSIEHLSYLTVYTPEKQILSLKEIKCLFDACDNSKLGMRDKAMLSLYYSCGLRRDEALHIEISDIDFNSNVLFVRKGKGDKQRYVPFTEYTHKILREYINFGRRRLNRKHKLRKALLINFRGERIKSQALKNRLDILCKKANITQKVGLHTLRHSIATHLLQQNMSIYDIKEFLGHSSLESTQIYTHIIDGEI